MMMKMNAPKLLYYLSLTTAGVVAFLLISGAAILTKAVPFSESIPMGTPISYSGIVALSMALWLSVQNRKRHFDALGRYFHIVAVMSLMLAILWLPVSWLLAGNLSFTFTEKAEFQGGQQAMRLFWIYSGLVVMLPLAVTLLYYIIMLAQKLRNR